MRLDTGLVIQSAFHYQVGVGSGECSQAGSGPINVILDITETLPDDNEVYCPVLYCNVLVCRQTETGSDPTHHTGTTDF